MNQFKRAKQLRAEAGQSIENITDLKTAGVTTKEDKKNSLPSNITTSSTNKSDNISGNKAQDNVQTENFPISTANSILSSVAEQASTEQFEHKNEDAENTLPVIEHVDTERAEHTKQGPSIINATGNTHLSDNVNIQTENEIISEEQHPILEQSSQTIAMSIPNEIPKTIDVPIIIEETASLTPSEPTLQDEANIPIITSIPYKEPPILDTSSQKHSKNTKKSVPNIFAPKGEAKSMRKSLVLKPTSVKIAENYCAKNGGSFNELIQTLLDNFIDEYGL